MKRYACNRRWQRMKNVWCLRRFGCCHLEEYDFRSGRIFRLPPGKPGRWPRDQWNCHFDFVFGRSFHVHNIILIIKLKSVAFNFIFSVIAPYNAKKKVSFNLLFSLLVLQMNWNCTFALFVFLGVVSIKHANQFRERTNSLIIFVLFVIY